MKRRIAGILAVLCLIVQGIWAQTSVTTEKQLTDAIADGATNIQLTGDILLNSYLNIDGKTVTIDLNGHKLTRSITDYDHAGHVIYAHGGSNLTLTSTAEDKGVIEGGMAYNGGAINIPHGNTVSATNIIFQNNTAREHAGAIWNNGTFTAINCTFTRNSCTDVGAVYNAVHMEGNIGFAGTATLTGCTITGNWGTTGAGALANALGATVMTIDDCTITDNTAGSNSGAGIWNGGFLKMKGVITVKDNMNVSGIVSNVFLKCEKVITVTGSLAGSTIGVDMESVTGTFTSGYNDYNSGVDPKTLFSADRSSMMDVAQNGNEAELASWYPDPANTLTFIERSWDNTNKKVVSTEKILTSLIDYDEEPHEANDYKEVTNAPSDTPNEWFGMGGYSTTIPEYYVVRGQVNRQTIVVQGRDVHLILCNGATLNLTGGLKLEGDNKLYIHCQSYASYDMGKLIVTNSYENGAGIGSAPDNGAAKTVGELVIYGGHIEATGAKYAAGIGSCGIDGSETELCNKVTVYGGYVKAVGDNSHASGIGGGGNGVTGTGIKGGTFTLYDGTVIATGASGVGGGFKNDGGTVFIYGGSLTAKGNNGSGIGCCHSGQSGGTVTITGGTVTASCSAGSAGIGGGDGSGKSNGKVVISGGTVTAIGSSYGAGIGGGTRGGADVTITGGMVTATGGNGIGSGLDGKQGSVVITGGTVIATGGRDCAGIGGGLDGTVTISGGTVTATGGSNGAGIGGRYSSSGGNVIISGGTVTATGGGNGAGIGGGHNGIGANVTITGGTIIAKAGTQGGEGNRAIGPGKMKTNYGTLTIDNTMMVGAGNNGSVERIMNADERKNGCWYRSYAEISPCTHPSGLTYTINEGGTHTSHCKHCTAAETAAHFNSDGQGTCVCGYKDGKEYHTITMATSNGTGYEGVGESVNVGNGKPYTLPVCSTIPEGYDFAGWVVNPQSHDNGIRPNDGETLLQAGEDITITADVTIFARYQALEISLADDSDNSETLYTYNGRTNASVTLTGRKLYKDGTWNTLCLPFSMTAEQVSAQLAPAALMELDTEAGTYEHITGFENGTLYLNFKNAGSIEAGKPYIIKWNATTPDYITDPVFSNVTISNALTQVQSDDGTVAFVGNYNPVSIGEGGDNTMLYLGADNTLYYPSAAMAIGACRAYFRLNGITAGTPTDPQSGNILQFVLNFDEESTGIENVQHSTFNVQSEGWFTLDGRRLSGKPTTKGIYINNGNKIVIK